MDFAVLADHRIKLKKAKRKISTWTLLENWKTVEHESDDDTNCNWCSWYSHQRIGRGTGGLGNKRTSKDYPKYGFIKIGQSTEKSPGDLRRLVVTQTPVRNHRLTLVRKTRKGVNDNNDNLVKDYKRKTCLFTDISVPSKEYNEILKRYREERMKKMLYLKATTVQVIMGALTIIKKGRISKIQV